MITTMVFGVDHFISKYRSPGKNLGLLTNDAALTTSGISSRLALLKAGFSISRIFSPEHGLMANRPDGAPVEDQQDPLTGLPVVSLYGDQMKPRPEQLSGLDAVLFDIPDVGCRFYTYLWTMTYMMDACREASIPLWILDRPNPIGGRVEMAEGPLLDETHCSSFIGRWDIPIRHSLTLGELARYFAATRVMGLQLEVVPCQGWNRSLTYMESGHPFIPTSPAMRDAETALMYPGTGLLEGININEGRGTAQPFRQMGAPWIDGKRLLKGMGQMAIAGMECYPIQYIPDMGLFAGEKCRGLKFRITDPGIFRPVHFGIQLIKLMMYLHPDHVLPRPYVTAANPSGSDHLDRLTGVQGAFQKLLKNEALVLDVNPGWKDAIMPYLLYSSS
ncbi:MAG TPA: DUF1343 domain-containing protein [Phnomibacter sp.]|nr:DUF1343 domain-containing protein [Phnomibacter sp.]